MNVLLIYELLYCTRYIVLVWNVKQKLRSTNTNKTKRAEGRKKTNVKYICAFLITGFLSFVVSRYITLAEKMVSELYYFLLN